MKRRTPDHPKTLTFAELLKVPRFGAVGLLELLWHYAAEFAPQGNVGKYSNEAIARACYWPKNADALINAFVTAGWIDKDDEHRLLIHDWDDHMDETTRKRLMRAKRVPITRLRIADPAALVPSVYFIQGSQSKSIKIGFTEASVTSRMDALQTASPEPLLLLASYPGSRSDESALHRRFAKDSITGEWFKESEDLLSVIASVATSGCLLTQTAAERPPEFAARLPHGSLAGGKAGQGKDGQGKDEPSEDEKRFWIAKQILEYPGAKVLGRLPDERIVSSLYDKAHGDMELLGRAFRSLHLTGQKPTISWGWFEKVLPKYMENGQ